MGIFDKMFGAGASKAQQEPNSQARFNELKGKYQSVLTLIEQQEVQLQNLHVQDNKLFIKGSAPSSEAKDKVWDQIKLVDSNYSLTQPPTRKSRTLEAGNNVGTLPHQSPEKPGSVIFNHHDDRTLIEAIVPCRNPALTFTTA